MGMMQDKRGNPRVELNRLVRLVSPSRDTLFLIGINVSSSGMALQSKQPLFVGERVELRFRFSDQDKSEYKLNSEVVHNYRQGEVYTSGLKFLDEMAFAELH